MTHSCKFQAATLLEGGMMSGSIEIPLRLGLIHMYPSNMISEEGANKYCLIHLDSRKHEIVTDRALKSLFVSNLNNVTQCTLPNQTEQLTIGNGSASICRMPH